MRSFTLPLHAATFEPSADASDPLLRRLSRRLDVAVDLRDYLVFDRRTLGVTRILMGFLLLGDLFHRGRWWSDLYSDVGVVPRASAAAREVLAFSIFNAFGSPRELAVLFAIMAVVFGCLLVGYKTRIAQILALVLVTGMDARNTMTENAGYIAENLLVLWTCFLPLGDRFSVDAVLASMRRGSSEDLTAPRAQDPRGHAHLTLLGPVVLMQLAVVYFMSSVHKVGWRWLQGKAVHYVMHCDRMISPPIALVRDHVPNWLVHATTYGALGTEAILAFVILSPFYRAWTRRAAIVLIVGLHTAFGALLSLGPFSWTMCVFASLLASAADWELMACTMRRPSRARTVIYDATSARAEWVSRLLHTLDGLDLLTFRAAADGAAGPLGLAVEAPSGARPRSPSAMVRDLITALPLGPVAALPLRLPLVPRLVDALLALVARLERFPVAAPARAQLTTGLQAAGARTGGRLAIVLREALIVLLFAGAVPQALRNAPIVRAQHVFTVPEPFRTVNVTLRLFQGWHVMAPDTPEEGILVVDAVTKDGRHVDPLSLNAAPYTLRPPLQDLAHAKGLGFDQAWQEYLYRVARGGDWAEVYREPLKDYLRRLPERTGHPEDTLVSGDVYWLSDEDPRWNENAPYDERKEKLFSF